MKTDAQLQRDVLDKLHWQPNISEAEIGVAAKEGVITLTGSVDSYAAKYAAERAAERVSGVRAVADELKVTLSHDASRTDTDLAHAAVSALKWNVEVPYTRIQVAVDNGWLTIDGTVDWQFQKSAAETVLRYLRGVKGIINRVEVRQPKISALEVSQKIKDALRRTASIEANRISVEATGSRVTLRGTVRSWAEREDAERAAWAAPGVAFVDDEIAVGV